MVEAGRGGGPSSNAYALPVEAVANSNRLVIDDTEVEKMTKEVEAGGEEEEQ